MSMSCSRRSGRSSCSLAALGVIAAVRIGSWQDRLLVAWLLVPLAFFEIWPVKGYQYLLPVAPAIAILAARAFEAPWTDWFRERIARAGFTGERSRARGRSARSLIPIVALLSLVPTTSAAVLDPSAQGSLAGTGGLPGGREAG